MRQNTLARRLDLLSLEGDGLFEPEIVKKLSEKHACTPRTVYYDFQTKPKWQPYIEGLIRVYLRIVNRHDNLYRKASLEYQRAGNVKEKLMAINLMRTINNDFYEFAKGTGYQPKQVKPLESRELKWVDPPEWRRKLYQSTTNHTQGKLNSTKTKRDSGSSLAEEDGEKPLVAQTKQSAKRGKQGKTT